MADIIALVTWADSSKAYQAMTNLRNGSFSFDLVQAAIVQRNVNGTLEVKDGGNAVVGSGAVAGSLLGMLVGVLGGPVGVLLGWGSGAVFGSLADADVVNDSDSILASMSRAVLPGTTALLLELNEPTPAELDAFVAKEGGVIVRRPADEVRAEIAAAQDAAAAAAAEAHRVVHEQKKQENKDKLEATWNHLKDKFKKTFS